MSIIISVLGGLGLFLYGMNLMGSGLQKSCGEKLKGIIAVITKNKIYAVLVGVFVTMIIQSSSATTVMVIGFVNAGFMTLTQAVGIIIGANLGTTITAQIIAFDISKYAPIVIAIGVFMWLRAKNDKKKDVSEILIGFGILFLGMSIMSSGLSPLAKEEWFKNILIKLNNPFVGVIAGLVLTTILQSSSASIGLLEALGMQGLININQAFGILFGDNIGTTTTALISSIGANKNAKRAAFIHFLFNFIGTIIFMLMLRKPVQILVEHISPGNVQRQIANAHTLFNLINVIIQLPFSNLLVKIAEKFIKGTDESESNYSVNLDKRILETPSIAILQAQKEVVRMGEIVFESLEKTIKCFESRDTKQIEFVLEREKMINGLEKEILDYLVLLSDKNLSDEEKHKVFVMMYSINDYERIGDHCENIIELIQEIKDENSVFSKTAYDEYEVMSNNILDIVSRTNLAYKNSDIEMAKSCINIEEEVDNLEESYRKNHMDRINRGICDTNSGVKFLDILSNFERIADHSVNIANYTSGKEL
ncbi:MAG: Na/Pi cotransporter family protein [Peptoniphilaceae bacterium]|uniref:Na/Pi cotransporter family protein n=1 Tax=Parvimonas sp. TaxID=1944660 RepID=UPI0025D23F42|nr:Na/Pi cotransporter family protein [Parvimonas sp.]MCI5996969.1 Na/Pi cotransporter family protein [Parvimonas sp.]MDD7765055.1 Na/Pi cotransporter family protein [Peptoniphilaceae bacterium]MDY3050261.1 Na/Pi cotransporter family protein [Parvimonas sp.]